MSAITIATWNVLHRIHAENWAEPAIEEHPDERARIEAIATRLDCMLLVDRTIDAIGLQRADTASKSSMIDHVVVHRVRGDNARVISAQGLSDHNLVLARIVL